MTSDSQHLEAHERTDVDEGDLFTHLESGDRVVVTTHSDTYLGSVYLKYLDGRPAGTIDICQLLSNDFKFEGKAG